MGDLGLLFTVFRAYFDAFARPLCRVHPAAACFDEVLAHVMLPYPWCQHESVPRRRRLSVAAAESQRVAVGRRVPWPDDRPCGPRTARSRQKVTEALDPKRFLNSGAFRDNKALCLDGYMIVFESLIWHLAQHKFQRQINRSRVVSRIVDGDTSITRDSAIYTKGQFSRWAIASYGVSSTGRTNKVLFS